MYLKAVFESYWNHKYSRLEGEKRIKKQTLKKYKESTGIRKCGQPERTRKQVRFLLKVLDTHRIRVSWNCTGCRWRTGNYGADKWRQGASGNNQLDSIFGFLEDADSLLMSNCLVKCLPIDSKDLICLLQSSISIKDAKGSKRYLTDLKGNYLL